MHTLTSRRKRLCFRRSLEKEPMNRVSRTQLALLSGSLEAARRLDTAPRVPMAIVLTLCEHYFSATPVNVLRSLRLMGYVDFDDVQPGSFLRVRRLPQKEEILHTSEEADALPCRDSIELLVNAFHLRGHTDEKDLGRHEPDDFEPEDARTAPTTKTQQQILEFLANHLLLEVLVGGSLLGPLATSLVNHHWSNLRHPGHRRQTVREHGLIRFHPNDGWSLTHRGRMRAKGTTATLSRDQAIAMITRAGLHPRTNT